MSYPDVNSDNSGAAAGFDRVNVPIFRDGEIRNFHIFLPTNSATEAYLEVAKTESQEQLTESIQSRAKPSPRPFAGKNDEPDLSSERKRLNDKAIVQSAFRDGSTFQVYEWDEPLKLIENLSSSTSDRDTKQKHTELFARIKAKGNYRDIRMPLSHEYALEKLESLRESQPHFSAVIDFLREHLLLTEARGVYSYAAPMPILLYGEPGVGKTYFTQKLAKVLNQIVRRQAFDSSTTDSALTGSDKHWSNSTYGIIFDLICLGESANPIVLLDEIDKANGASTYGYRDPLAPLHTLLEPITSSKVRDSSVGLEFDASRIFYVATANDPHRVPASLRSRFIEFHIQSPRGEHALKVAQAIAETVFNEMDLPRFESVSLAVVKLIAHLTPREQCQALKRAFAAAVSDRRSCIDRLDLPLDVLVDDIDADASGGSEAPQFIH